MDKGAWRRRLLQWRDDLGARDREKREAALAAWATRWLGGMPPGILMAYAAIRSEVNLKSVVEWAWNHGWTVAFPRVEESHRISAVAADSWEALSPGAFGIPEPTGPALSPGDLDVIVVPGAAFDRLGRRLGYGQGFYDRFLPQVPQAKVVGAAFAEQWVDALPADPHDVPVQYVLTEYGVWSVQDRGFVDLGGGTTGERG
ncbi:5-formyltetrahydrofolate cyclo-ligase [Kyrpidia tusciae]|uniref:5-formyltetrahydrofolate cyclo-ligase n=1 Tax=Kyrpidia tusciae (strain DSM 2912 / NBRC 15312 / T2) TaxID=562970 RepID=D5WSC1_KYRT2|nr:5-formyltetrahydrofolate cyclo-ligase [Kyrpidia tusciae]ADG05006.1 5-formyltetrahydrofolate cyclo-ligase [Kyrpidia tusciae DSM 2912]